MQLLKLNEPIFRRLRAQARKWKKSHFLRVFNKNSIIIYESNTQLFSCTSVVRMITL